MGTLPVRPVTTQGTWRVNYRLGDDMVIRLPRVPETGGVGTLLEHGLLLRLARFLPAAVPELIGRGRPTADYPCAWRWLDGDTPVDRSRRSVTGLDRGMDAATGSGPPDIPSRHRRG